MPGLIYDHLYMSVKSAGILIYSITEEFLRVFLVHPGGPIWAGRDTGAWTIPKGELQENEKPLEAALRELKEETGMEVHGEFLELSPVKLKSGKLIYAWALLQEPGSAEIKSNTFEMEWPPGSGKKKTFPEIDKASWFEMDTAIEKINKGQLPLLLELQRKIQL